MKRKVTLPWNAASWRSRTYAPRVEPKPFDDGGDARRAFWATTFPREVRAGHSVHLDKSCQGCGFHVCICEEMPPTLSVERARELMDSISSLNSVVRGKPEPSENTVTLQDIQAGLRRRYTKPEPREWQPPLLEDEATPKPK
jgi:hypothetical protein